MATFHIPTPAGAAYHFAFTSGLLRNSGMIDPCDTCTVRVGKCANASAHPPHPLFLAFRASSKYHG